VSMRVWERLEKQTFFVLHMHNKKLVTFQKKLSIFS
jgi:hypothetical protein